MNSKDEIKDTCLILQKYICHVIQYLSILATFEKIISLSLTLNRFWIGKAAIYFNEEPSDMLREK